IRGGAVVALTALGLALAVIAWQERVISATAGAASDPDMLAAVSGHLRYAIVLLLVVATAVTLVAGLGVPGLPRSNQRSADATQAAVPQSMHDGAVDVASSLPVSLAHVGHLMSVGSLIRGFCHELTNQLGPVQSYSELLCDDAGLSDLHRRQVMRIRDATRMALVDVRSFGAALGWSSDPAQITRLGEMA